MENEMTLSYLEKKLLEKKQQELKSAICKAVAESADIINNAIGGYQSITSNEAKEINDWLADVVRLKLNDGKFIVAPLWQINPPPALQRGLLKIASQELLEKVNSISELMGE